MNTTMAKISTNRLFAAMRLDMMLQLKYQIFTAGLIVALLYTAVFLMLPFEKPDKLLVLLIFSDPTVLGFIFIGAIFIFEKDQNTLQAIAITPLKDQEFLLSKSFSLTFNSAICSLIIIISVKGLHFNLFYFLSALLLSSNLFIFLGVIGVLKVKTINQYIFIIPFFIAPLSVPILNYLGVVHSWLFYLIPSQASLELFHASFNKIPFFTALYSYAYLLLWNYLAYKYAVKSLVLYKQKN